MVSKTAGEERPVGSGNAEVGSSRLSKAAGGGDRGRRLRVGSRASKLALWQTEAVIRSLKGRHPEVEYEVVIVHTYGDKVTDVPLTAIGDTGLFVKEIEVALAAGEIDFAVHSMKDVPTALAPGMVIAAVPERADPRDAFVSHKFLSLTEVPPGGRIGTGSLRRVAQLRAARPDLVFEPLRGNLDTRLRKLAELDLDGIILAAAGLERLGWTSEVRERLDSSVCLPAAGQGALAVEARAEDGVTLALLADIDDGRARLAVEAERAFLDRLGGGCHVPVGALARVDGSSLSLAGVVADPEGKRVLRDVGQGRPEHAAIVGRDLAERMLAAGAAEILASLDGGGAR